MKAWKAALIFLIGGLSFGITPVFSKLGFAAGFSLGEIIWRQMLISFIILWSITAVKKHNGKKLSRKNVITLMLSGTLASLTNVFYYASMLYIPASIAVILVFQFVWIGVLYDWLFSKIIPQKTTLVSVAITLVGIFLAANVTSGEVVKMPLLAIIFGFCSAFCFAGFIYASGKVAKKVDPLIRTSLMVSGSLILITIIFPPSITIESMTNSVWIYSLGVAIFGSILPPLLFSISAPHLPNSICSILGTVELPMTVIMAKVVLSENITLIQWFGVLIILIGISFKEVNSWIFKFFDKKNNIKEGVNS
ncbi:hypothetical protein BHT94_20850 [Bacillus licheniformis]|nr:hypothetical protein BHT94_20850 [Bacillus licheniformis]